MTRLELIDLAIRLSALEAERPLPPDPYLAAMVKCRIVGERGSLVGAELERRVDELESLRAMHEIVQAECRALLDELDALAEAGEHYLRTAAREHDSSPWPAFFDACREQRAGDDDVRSSEDSHE